MPSLGVQGQLFHEKKYVLSKTEVKQEGSQLNIKVIEVMLCNRLIDRNINLVSCV